MHAATFAQKDKKRNPPNGAVWRSVPDRTAPSLALFFGGIGQPRPLRAHGNPMPRKGVGRRKTRDSPCAWRGRAGSPCPPGPGMPKDGVGNGRPPVSLGPGRMATASPMTLQAVLAWANGFGHGRAQRNRLLRAPFPGGRVGDGGSLLVPGRGWGGGCRDCSRKAKPLLKTGKSLNLKTAVQATHVRAGAHARAEKTFSPPSLNG